MLIDWFTVGAQAVNFLLLVWLLKRFLYKPILHAIDAREERIRKEVADADAMKSEAERERDAYRDKNEEFDRERAAVLRQATEEAAAERLRLLGEARQEAGRLVAQRREMMKRDAATLQASLEHRARQEVFAIVRKVLGDLASASLEERMVEVFTRLLRDLEGESKQALAAVLRSPSSPARIRSAIALPEAQRAAIQMALNQTFAADTPLHYETAPELVSGIELSAGGHQVAWSIAGYLGSLREGVDALLDGKGSNGVPTTVDADEPKPEIAGP